MQISIYTAIKTKRLSDKESLLVSLWIIPQQNGREENI